MVKMIQRNWLLTNALEYRSILKGQSISFIWQLCMENKMETTIVYWGCIGIMESTMEAAIMGYMVVGFLIVFVSSTPSPIPIYHNGPT